MDLFEYRDGRLTCEDVPAESLAERFGTPLYVYSRATLITHFDRFAAAFAPLNPLICYSIKCCQNVHICRLLRERGSGFDVVSGGELFRALKAGADPAKIVFAGVGKTQRELTEALDARIGLFNIESESELGQLSALAADRGVAVNAALRVNPDVDAGTHKYTTTGVKRTKFGVDIETAAGIFSRHARAADAGGRSGLHGAVRLCGIHLHIGSPVNDPSVYRIAIARGMDLISQLKREGHDIDLIDVGGGFGAHYRGGEAPPAAEYAAAITPLLAGGGLRVIIEPGRSIAANAAVILTRVLHTKDSGGRRFVIVDAAMNELIRPALYGAYHFIWPADAAPRHQRGASAGGGAAFVPATRDGEQPMEGLLRSDIVGPVCESGDFLAQDRPFPPVERGDLLAVFTAGAYAMTMSSQYNSRPRAAEVLVDGDRAALIRRRETYDDLLAPEIV